MPESPFFSVFIPTYNRAQLISRAIKSIYQQCFTDYEIIVIDDASSDNTTDVIDQLKTQYSSIQLNYVKQLRNGKIGAHNTALKYANGFLLVTLDSDDVLAPSALKDYYEMWMSIPEESRHKFVGVEGLGAYLYTHTIAGKKYPESPLDSHYLELQYHYKDRGDKKPALRLDILRRYPYPDYPGEYHLKDSYLWENLAAEYKTRYFNTIVQFFEYQPDGLSSNNFKKRMENTRGYREYYKNLVTNHGPWLDKKRCNKAVINYVRYSLHARETLNLAKLKHPYSNHRLSYIIKGYCKYLGDLVQQKTIKLNQRLSNKP